MAVDHTMKTIHNIQLFIYFKDHNSLAAMQARDVELIKDKQLRAAQEIKQAAQDKEILGPARLDD